MSSPGVDPLNVLEIDEPDTDTEQKTPGLEVLSQEVRRLGRELFRVSRTSERNQQICEEAIAQLSNALAQVSEHSAEAVFQAKAALCQDLFAVVDSLEASCDTAKNLLKQLDGKRAQLDRGFLFQFSKARQLRADWVECVKVMSQWLEGQQLLYQRVMTVLQSAGVRSIETLSRPFDPAFHRAVSTEPRRDLVAGTIVDEELKGYMLDGRILRFAEVVVVKNE